MRKEKSSGIRPILAILLVFGILVTGLGLFNHFRIERKYRYYVPVKAEVYDVKSGLFGNSTVLTNYNVRGIDYEFKFSVKNKAHIGDRLDVYYDSDRPEKVVKSIDDEYSVKITIFGAFIILIAVAGCAVSGTSRKGLSFSGVESNANSLINGLEGLLEDDDDDDDDDEDEESEDEEIESDEESESQPENADEEKSETDSEPAEEKADEVIAENGKTGIKTLSDIEDNAADIIDGLEKILD